MMISIINDEASSTKIRMVGLFWFFTNIFLFFPVLIIACSLIVFNALKDMIIGSQKLFFKFKAFTICYLMMAITGDKKYYQESVKIGKRRLYND